MQYLEIEWRHLDKDGKTCDRCSDTGESVRTAHEMLVQQLRPKGWQVVFKETLLTADEVSESNAILLNGVLIEQLLPNARKTENCCASCGDLLGAPTLCRALIKDGRTYDAIPASLIVEAAQQLVHRKSQ